MGNQTLGRGKVYFSLLKDDGVTPVGYRYLGNTPSFNLNIDNEKLDHFSSDEGIRQKDKSVVLETTATGSLEADDISLENLALFFFGSASVLAQSSATSQTYTINDAQQGMMYQVGWTATDPTGVHSLTSVVVKVGVTTKTLNTDYTLNAELGQITIVEGGGIANDDDVIVEYSRSAKSRTQVISGDTQVEGSIRFESKNPEGDKMDYVIPYCRMAPNGDFALKSDEWQTLSLAIEILKLNDLQRIYVNGRPYTP